MNDSQQFEIFKFPHSIGLVIVAIYWLYARKERVEREEMTWREILAKPIRGKQ